MRKQIHDPVEVLARISNDVAAIPKDREFAFDPAVFGSRHLTVEIQRSTATAKLRVVDTDTKFVAYAADITLQQADDVEAWLREVNEAMSSDD